MSGAIGGHRDAMIGGHGGGIAGRISTLEEEKNQIQVAATVSALPDASGLTDGTLAAVMSAADNGLPSLYMVRGGLWVQPVEAGAPTIAFVTTVGAGAGELPEDVVVGSGVDAPLGVGWALDGTLSGSRPADIAVTPLDPDELTIGAKGGGLWRIAAQVEYDTPSDATGVQTWFVLQRDDGGGWTDLNYGNLMMFNQDPPNEVTGLSQTGFALSVALNAGDKLRVVVRHDGAGSRTYTLHGFALAMNQQSSTPT